MPPPPLTRRRTVESLIYWRDVKKSGIVFGAGLVLLLAISVCSVISVFAYTSLIALVSAISFRIYKNVLQAVQKTPEGHPFADYLSVELALPQEKVQELAAVSVAHVNALVVELRRLFLVEDLIDSIKFGLLLWGLTYLGSWFNGMTLVILGEYSNLFPTDQRSADHLFVSSPRAAFVALFTFPKVYENNKQDIDAHLGLVRSKIEEISEK